MKVLSILITLLFLTPYAVKAADISLGANAWYATWDMRYKRDMGENGPKNSVMGPELLYGPVAAIKLSSDFSISSVFLYTNKFIMGDNEDTKITRMDSDTVLNYSVNRYIKIFGGVKFMRFTWDQGSHQGTGPGAGLGVTLPVVGNLFLIGNASSYYLYGKHKQKDMSISQTLAFREPGFSGTASCAYYIEQIATTVSAGYRYQFFTTKYTRYDEYNPDMDHIFKGFTASAIFTF